MTKQDKSLKKNDEKRVKYPLADWMLFVFNFIWAFGIYRLIFHRAANPQDVQLQFVVVWVGLIGAVATFILRTYLYRKKDR